MRPTARTAALLAALALAAPAHGQGRAEVAERLEAAQEAVERLRRHETDVASETEAAERALRDAEEMARAARAELDAARGALADAKAEESRARAAFEERTEAITPRLRQRYRMLRQGSSGALLLADSPAAWLRLQRSFDTILEADLAALRGLREAAEAQAAAREAIEAAQVSLAARVDAARAAEAEARTAAEARAVLLAAVQEERALQEGALQALAAAQARLDGEVARLRAKAAAEADTRATGFRRLRGRLSWPVEGGIVEVPFGKVVNARFGTVTQQNGIDVRVHEGAEVRAVAAGAVAWAGWFRGFGNLVIVDHGDGYHSLYAHLAATAQAEGDPVEAGDLVGLVGDTGSLKGAYLYFELRKDGKPVNPMPWFGR